MPSRKPALLISKTEHALVHAARLRCLAAPGSSVLLAAWLDA
jgi:hypothetical protein